MKIHLSTIFLISTLTAFFLLPACTSKTSSSDHRKTWHPSSFDIHKEGIDEHLIEMLMEINNKIKATAGIKAELALVPGALPNAYAWDKNNKHYIALNVSLLELLGENEDEYAFVIAHESAHISKKHIKKRANYDKSIKEKSNILSMVMEALGFGFGIPFSGLISSVTVGSGTHLMKLGYSRNNEREADKEGIRYMNDSGYNLTGAVTFLEKLLALPNNTSIPILSTHPHSRERINLLKKEISLLAPNKQHL